jgi:hypothetical protein
LRRAIIVGVVFELLVVVSAYFYPWLIPHFLLFGCMLLSGVAGLLYARDLARGFGAGALGGAAVGALCGVVAVYSADFLGEQPALYLPYGVMVLTLTGAVGGLFGQLDAVIKKFLKTLQ